MGNSKRTFNKITMKKTPVKQGLLVSQFPSEINIAKGNRKPIYNATIKLIQKTIPRISFTN